MKLQEALILVVIFYFAYTQLVRGQPQPPQGFQTRCGNVTIEYPFGTSPGCYYGDPRSFQLTCNEKEELLFGNIPAINISHSGELRVRVPPSYSCYNSRGNSSGSLYNTFRLGNLSLSTKNKFTAVGCNTFAFLSTYGVANHAFGCMSICASPPEANGECSGKGCCESSVPRGSSFFRVEPYSFNNHTFVHSFNPCSYAFLVENGTFNFDALEYLKNLRNVADFPVVLDWSIGK